MEHRILPVLSLMFAFAIPVMANIAPAYAQQTVPETGVPAKKSSHALVQGILPMPGMSGGTRHNLMVFGPDEQDPSADDGLMWLEMGMGPTTSNGVSAQLGLGYAPSSDLGLSFGPVVELNGTLGQGMGAGYADDYSVTPTQRQGGSTQRLRLTSSLPSGQDNAGLAASLSYMPLQDIWIGVHGRVTSDFNAAPGSTLPGVDAMLGLTAGYRLEF
ncbi:hypothetical protein [Thalassospira sp.]|uniref:hypothetical protein n=1 Tax=Thalassospira sp. TaxID=1912094 RepID=UPI002733D968|nr:hypothetical protein [Thalassospira sp.]MDP2699573.1 hypothetical protein [Thalassospira sp.]